MANFALDDYNRPVNCNDCGGLMIFKGVGEYECEDCKKIEFDDFGKVRAFIETHKGSNAAQIEEGTGVKQRSIRQMLREKRLEVTMDSRAFLHCDICGVNIRSGRFCQKCESLYHQRIEEENRTTKSMKGVAMGNNTETGAKRFERKY
ncbi:MAG TPA: hypothetical protein VJZ04_09785 [Lachnospiraceae bacterium]|nr:hypothetical protein [Lachnospiraceae bacterium]